MRKHHLILLALALTATAAAAATITHLRREREELVADLMRTQDTVFDLHDQIEHLQGQRTTSGSRLTGSAEGGVWLYRDGWCAARGPYDDHAQARADAEVAATQYAPDVIHVLGTIATVSAPAAQPVWDE